MAPLDAGTGTERPLVASAAPVWVPRATLRRASPSELCSSVVDAAKGPRVTAEPRLLELESDVPGRPIVNPGKLRKRPAGVDDCQRPHDEGADGVDIDRPWAHEINGDLFPRGRHIISWRKVPVAGSWILVALA